MDKIRKIGIDIRPLQTAFKRVGIGTYTLNLIKNLLKLDSDYEFIFCALRDVALENGLNIKKKLKLNRPKRVKHIAFWEQVLLPFDLVRGRFDLYHSTGGLTQVWEIGVPYFQPCETVVTIYDLHPIIFPKFAFIANARMYKIQLKAAKKATQIITISESTKRDIIRLLGIPEEKITVIYLAYSENFKPISDNSLLESVKAKYGITGNFVLYVGNYNVHKNIEGLITACAKLKDDFNLVIVGRKSSYPDAIFSQIDNLQLRKKVVFTDSIPTLELALLYNAATVFVFPSFHEGFGIPPLEAMSCGCPVISSNRASLPEVVGDAGILIEPDDIDRLATAIQEVLTNQKLKARLKAAGLKQAAKFSWKKTVQQTLEVYKKALS